jgi:hypothetical protein
MTKGLLGRRNDFVRIPKRMMGNTTLLEARDQIRNWWVSLKTKKMTTGRLLKGFVPGNPKLTVLRLSTKRESNPSHNDNRHGPLE